MKSETEDVAGDLSDDAMAGWVLSPPPDRCGERSLPYDKRRSCTAATFFLTDDLHGLPSSVWNSMLRI